VGATGNFAHYSVFTKLVLSFDMMAGRLELYPLLIALSPSIWKKNV
jgi:trk system potassium uptake protein TrkH